MTFYVHSTFKVTSNGQPAGSRRIARIGCVPRR
jgi:hypothetical protein